VNNTGGQLLGPNDDITRIISGEMKNVSVDYSVPSSLILSNYPVGMTPSIMPKNGINILSWKIDRIGQGEEWRVSFNVMPNSEGNFTLGLVPDSKVGYIGKDGILKHISIPERYLSFTKGFLVSDQAKEFVSDKELSFMLGGQGSAFKVNEPKTNVTIEKLVVSGKSRTSPQIILRIITPKVDNISLIMALDSSGSSSLNVPPDKEAIKKEVPNFLKKLESTGIRANVSIVSWDDDIDYINGIRGIKTDKHMPINKTNQVITNLLSDSNFVCLENETTDFDKGLKTSIDLMNYNKPFEDPYAPQVLIFITGRSEFKNYTWKDYSNSTLPNIYPIGLMPGKQMIESLNWLATRSGGYYDISGSTSPELNRVLNDDFSIIMDKVLYGRPIAYNATIIDTLYPYLIPDETSIKAVTSFKNRTQKEINIKHNLSINSDKTSTLKLYIGNLTPDSITEIAFDTEFNMRLPVDVTRQKEEFKYSPNNSTPYSLVSYEWHRGGKFSLDLPENRITIGEGRKETGIEFGFLSLVAIITIFFRRNNAK
jgi:hypothetical protein